MKIGRLGLFQYRLGSAPVARMLERQPSRFAEIAASAGTAIVMDDSGIHRGASIRRGTRYALTNYIFAGGAITPATRTIFEPMLG